MKITDTALIAGGALSIFGIAIAASSALIGIVWVGAVYGIVALIPILVGMIFLERAMAAKVADMKSRAEARPVRHDPRSEAIDASINIILGTSGMIMCLALMGYGLYHLGEATSWWAVTAVIVLVAPWFALPYLAGQAGTPIDASARERASRRALFAAARLRRTQGT